MARQAHKPTAEQRRQVETMAGFGIPAADIARSLAICEPTLRKYYRDEMDLGTVKANSAIAQSLYKKALADGPAAVTACIFWLKTRAGWKETVVNEHTGADGGPIKTEVNRIERVIIGADEGDDAQDRNAEGLRTTH